jgi:hypothetical protein
MASDEGIFSDPATFYGALASDLEDLKDELHDAGRTTYMNPGDHSFGTIGDVLEIFEDRLAAFLSMVKDEYWEDMELEDDLLSGLCECLDIACLTNSRGRGCIWQTLAEASRCSQ